MIGNKVERYTITQKEDLEKGFHSIDSDYMLEKLKLNTWTI